jgi:hypothetical protein
VRRWQKSSGHSPSATIRINFGIEWGCDVGPLRVVLVRCIECEAYKWAYFEMMDNMPSGSRYDAYLERELPRVMQEVVARAYAVASD